MAWLEKRDDSYRIIFRFGGRRFARSLDTADRREANSSLTRLEDNLRLVEVGRLDVPPGVDLFSFLVSDGRLNGKPKEQDWLTLKEFFDRYLVSLPSGAKEANTSYTERIHLRHLLRVLGSRTSVRSVTAKELQAYVNQRATEKGRCGRTVCHVTIRKEIGTLASIWNKFGLAQGYVAAPAPTRGLVFTKDSSKLPFHTWQQIQRQIERGGLPR